MPSQFLKRFRLKTTLETGSIAVGSAQTSNSIPGSTKASQNAQASLAAVDELSRELKHTLNDLNSETFDGFSDFTRKHLNELEMEAERYTNSNVDESTARPWTCSSDAARLILTACRCSRDVNGKGDNQYTKGLVVVKETKSSKTGIRKAFSIWSDSANNTLIVAVRASKEPADYMVNMAHTTDKKVLPTATDLEGAHSGYLSCIEALIPELQAWFSQHVQNEWLFREVLFTGQSSGGAVASLLFFHFASQCSEVFNTSKVSLITFGCPSVTAQNITEKAEALHNVNLVLSMVNELDFVARADERYIRSILNLYRHKYRLPLATIGEEATLIGQQQAAAGSGHGVPRAWPLPSPQFFHIGKIVLLRPSLVNAQVLSPGCSELEYSDFAGLLFCHIDAHKGSEYLRRVEALTKPILGQQG